MNRIYKALINLKSESLEINFKDGKKVTGHKFNANRKSEILILEVTEPEREEGEFLTVSFSDIDFIVVSAFGHADYVLKNL